MQVDSKYEEALIKRAQEMLAQLRGARGSVSLSVEGSMLLLPHELRELMLEALEQMARGAQVQLVSRDAELTTQQAADILGVSRPFVVALMERGELPHRKVGAHRRVSAAALMAYKRRDDVRREEAAAALSEQAQQEDMGY